MSDMLDPDEAYAEYTLRLNPQPFRPLNYQEIGAVLAWEYHGVIPRLADLCLSINYIVDNFYVSYRRHRGNFTICTLAATYKHHKRNDPNISRDLSIEIRTGASRRHDKDKPNQLAGELASLQQAICAKPITLPNHDPVRV